MTTLIHKAVCVTAMTFALNSSAHAVVRSFVSNAGNDANTSNACAATTPCATFAAALSITNSGGEIVALTAGGYGPLNIARPLNVIGVAGASIKGLSNAVAITITAGASDIVIIRDIDIIGANAANSIGIQLNSGNLVLINSKLELLTTGLVVTNSHAAVINTDFVGNSTGIETNGTGVDPNVSPLSGPTEVNIFGGSAIGNTTAYLMNDPGVGTFGNKVTILEYIANYFEVLPGSFPPYSTNMASNGTPITGTGASCNGVNGDNCKQPGMFWGSANPN